MSLPVNFNAILVASFIPMIIGLLWYSPIIMGLTYKTALDEGDFDGKKRSSLLNQKPITLIIVSIICGFLIAFNLSSITIHQMGIGSTLLGEPGFDKGEGEAFELMKTFMEKYGHKFRSFGHGALHGAISACTYIMPILGLITLREGRSFKYFLVHALYWLLCLVLMGGLICYWPVA